MNLVSQLGQLESENLIRPTSQDGLEYIFKHALVQDTAYELLLKQDRRRLHRSVAQIIEELYADDLDEHITRLAQHYAEAGDEHKTYEYAIRAGDRAARLHAYVEARAHYAQAFALLPAETSTLEEKRQRVDDLIRQVSVSLFADDLNQQSERLSEAQTILHSFEMQEQDHLRHARIHYWLGRVYYFQNNMRQALQSFQHVLELANGLDDPEMLALPSAVIGRTLVLQGHWAKAEPLLRQALNPLHHAGKMYDYVVTLAFIGMTEMAQGNFLKGRAIVLDALEQAQVIEHPTAINVVRVAYGYIMQNGGEYELVIEQAQKAERMARKMDDFAWVYVAHGLSAWALTKLGRFEQAMAEYAKQESFPPRLGGSLILSDWFASARAELAYAMGDYEHALELAQAAVSYTHKMDGVYAEGLAERVWGQALGNLRINNFQEAEAHLIASLKLFENENAKIEAARTRLALGELYQSRDKSTARDYWTHAAATFSSAGLNPELTQAQNLLREAT